MFLICYFGFGNFAGPKRSSLEKTLADPLQHLVMDPTDEQLEYDAIKSGAGISPLDDRLFVRVSGDDRVSFMHGMCTADVKNLMPGDLARALFLTEHAHVVADCFIYALEEPVLWLEVERPRWTILRKHLERFLVADDVELDELDMFAALDIEGPTSIEAVASSFGDSARELKHWQHLMREGYRIANLPRYGGPAFTIIADRNVLASMAEQMRQPHPEMRQLHANTLETLRIESGLARVGIDTKERTLALEARLEAAIAFYKGCYVGQETIERASAHGSLKRRLFGVRVTGNRMPKPGALIKLAGKDVGYLSSVARSPLAGIIGLAILHHSAWAVDTRLSISIDQGTVSGLVCELPFLPADSAITNDAIS
jgi:folate-binding protein YgfZ